MISRCPGGHHSLHNARSQEWAFFHCCGATTGEQNPLGIELGVHVKILHKICVNRSAFLVSHSQIISDRQPIRVSSKIVLWSRTTVRSNLSRQNFTFDLGIVAFAQPGWRCQKQPCTNKTTRYRGKTRSGVPGRFFRCNLKRNPSACAARRTRISGDVFFDATLDISQDRRSGVNRSTTCLRYRLKTHKKRDL